eukprot:Blabericola_migrator_1__5582@NODE_283_length_10404_cov_699_850924_g233_i0_p5_GENE_NODE_283_length_10404_cov_699_850924_g233_i0NODE_283_length_10404_cov_699_850924_g233_i0_p5_ORF_typecomplete_len320_score39_29_NODE_283_length_10404_cov_699_850924_g233_i028953854
MDITFLGPVLPYLKASCKERLRCVSKAVKAWIESPEQECIAMMDAIRCTQGLPFQMCGRPDECLRTWNTLLARAQMDDEKGLLEAFPDPFVRQNRVYRRCYATAPMSILSSLKYFDFYYQMLATCPERLPVLALYTLESPEPELFEEVEHFLPKELFGEHYLTWACRVLMFRSLLEDPTFLAKVLSHEISLRKLLLELATFSVNRLATPTNELQQQMHKSLSLWPSLMNRPYATFWDLRSTSGVEEMVLKDLIKAAERWFDGYVDSLSETLSVWLCGSGGEPYLTAHKLSPFDNGWSGAFVVGARGAFLCLTRKRRDTA